MTPDEEQERFERETAAAEAERVRLAPIKTARAKRDLTYLIEQWPSIVELGIPGSRKRWVQSHPTGAISKGQLEDYGLDGVKGVARPAAADVHVLDLCTDYSDIARDLYWRTITIIGLQHNVFRPNNALAHPDHYFSVVSTFIWGAQFHDDSFGALVGHKIAKLVTEVARLLGDMRDGQVLQGICPWCHGRGADGIEGEATMRLHYPAELDNTAQPFDPDTRKRTADQKEPLIVCHGHNCTPPSNAYGQRWRDKPAWCEREWEWLAKQLNNRSSQTRRTA